MAATLAAVSSLAALMVGTRQAAAADCRTSTRAGCSAWAPAATKGSHLIQWTRNEEADTIWGVSRFAPNNP